MKNISCLVLSLLFFIACESPIKNEQAKVNVESGTEVPKGLEENKTPPPAAEEATEDYSDLLGFWVGYFRKDEEANQQDQTLYVDEGFIWNRENKINISIDRIADGEVQGHSVVAGNDRPFQGTMTKEKTDEGLRYHFQVKEPGDDKYDGEFVFTIAAAELFGKWTAYKNINIKNRKYSLAKRSFAYNPEIMLEQSKHYVNWNQKKQRVEKFEMEPGEFEEWISEEFATASHLIYEINASNRLLTKTEVENLKRGDLTIIRNTIYARHGYSFKNRPLRVFFDAQSWYIPVHSNIKNDFTDLEKTNIKLLLKYEKNAAEYYDSFGRG